MAFCLHAQNENTLLWKLEGNGIKKSYVFGTIHLIGEDDFELKEKLVKAMKKTSKLVMELDLSEPGMGKDIMRNLKMRNDTTLEQLLSEEDILVLDSVVSARGGLPFKMYHKWKPLFVSFMFQPQEFEGGTESYELSLTDMAKEGKMEIGALENVADQTAIFDSIPYQLQADMLMKTILVGEDEGSGEVSMANLTRLYKNEKIDSLYAISTGEFSHPLLAYYMLDKRNMIWIEKIHAMALEDKCLFAVGAGHLGGPGGILELLRQAGYKLTPVME